MKHCPAFDYNIIQLDNLILDIKDTYKEYLRNVNVRYDPPDSLYVEFIFSKNDKITTIKISWEVHQIYDRFRVASNVWTLNMNGIVEKNKTVGYIYKRIGEFLA